MCLFFEANLCYHQLRTYHPQKRERPVEQTKSIKGIWGFSSPFSITIGSKEFKCKAQYRSGEVQRSTGKSATNPLWGSALPGIFEFFLKLFKRLGWKMKIFTLLFIAFEASNGLLVTTTSLSVTFSLLNAWHILILQSLYFVFVWFFIAKNHGAEHMAIGAYLKTGEAGLDSIRNESPISKHCGARFAVVFILLNLLINAAGTMVGNNGFLLLAFTFISYQLIFIIDRKWGLWNIFPIGIISLLLQKHVLTRQPDEKHLLTAQSAMIGLIKAHETDIQAT